MPAARRYSDQEVRDILERALKADGTSSGNLAHSDLLAIGEQVGVAPDAMARAAEEVAREREEAALGSAITSRRRKWLALHAAVFALLNGSFFLVNYLTTPGQWWFLFSVFFWGLALLAHGGTVSLMGVSPRALERERRKGSNRARPQLRVDASTEAPPAASTGLEEGHVAEPTEASTSKARSR
jgi:hypothetical protein